MNRIVTPLSEIPPDSCCRIVSHISKNSDLKAKLLNLGLIPGKEIKVLYKSPGKDPVAYEVSGATFALRKEDTEKILVEI